MKISYDPKVDAMYIRFKSGKYDHTKKVSDEILDAKRQFGDIKSGQLRLLSTIGQGNSRGWRLTLKDSHADILCWL